MSLLIKADIDAKVAVHAALATVHQNAPGLIAAHALLSSAHHAKYTDAEVLTAIQETEGIFWWNNNWWPDGIIAKAEGGTGLVSWYNNQVWLETGATSGGYAHVEKTVSGPLPTTWEKKRYFRADVTIAKKITQYLHVCMGKCPNSGSGNTYNHAGFIVNGDAILGTVGNGTAESFLILEELPANGEARILEVIFTPGVEARFYIDGVDKGVRVTNLPSGTLYANHLLNATANNTSDYTKKLSITQVKFYQEG